MPTECENCKANPVDILTSLKGADLSDKAKLVAILEAFGVTDREQVESILEAKASTIRDARRALKIRRRKSVSDGNPAPEIQRNDEIPSQTTEIQRRKSSDPSRAHATKESPTEIVIYQEEVFTPLVPQAVEMLSPAEPAPAENQKARGTRLDDDWALPTEWRQWAEINTQLGSAGIEMEADKFRDFWIAQPGAKGRKSNWMATWRNWCRNAGSRRPYSPQRMAYDERKATAPKMGISEAFALYRQGARV